MVSPEELSPTSTATASSSPAATSLTTTVSEWPQATCPSAPRRMPPWLWPPPSPLLPPSLSPQSSPHTPPSSSMPKVTWLTPSKLLPPRLLISPPTTRREHVLTLGNPKQLLPGCLCDDDLYPHQLPDRAGFLVSLEPSSIKPLFLLSSGL